MEPQLSIKLKFNLCLHLLIIVLLAGQSQGNFLGGLTDSNSREDFIVEDDTRSPQPTYNPIIFIPGDGGSQLEAKLNKTRRVHYICDLTSDWYDIWLNIHLLPPGAFDCLSDNLKLHYNSSTRTTSNSDGVQIRPTSFGSLASVDYLDTVRIPGTSYFESVIALLEKERGFIRNVTMIGAAYDFRKAPNELGDYFRELKLLIEQFYVRNNYRKVTLICHSMGCLHSVYLLNRQTQDWKDVFIKRLITLAAPWHGSFKAISATLFGDNLGIPLLNQNKLQALQTTFPSLMYLLPRPPVFDEDRVLISSTNKNFTLKNLDEMFVNLSMLDQRDMWHDTRTIAANLTAPNVELWCLYGSGVNTPSKIAYDDTFNSRKYTEIDGDGDGTVNIESLRGCEYFAEHQERNLYTYEFENVDHIGIIRGTETAEFISSEIISRDLDDQ